MKGITKFIVILLGVLVVAALLLMIVAQTKNMTLIDYIKSWFETTKEPIAEGTKALAQAMIKI